MFEKQPGHNYCVESCSLWDCSPPCALPTKSCLFYRIFATPLSDTVYESFSCPDWKYGININLQLEVNQTSFNTDLELIEGLTSHWEQVSITPISISQPPAPLFNRKFITDGVNIAAVENFNTDLYCANITAAKNFHCDLTQEVCTECKDIGQIIHCKCRDSFIENFTENPEFKLPLMIGRYEVKNTGKNVYAESHHSSVQLHLKMESLKLLTSVDKNICYVKPIKISGCYRCEKGANFQFKCNTNYGTALAGKMH